MRSPGEELRGGGDMPGNGAVGLAAAMAAIQENVEYFEGDEEWVDVEEVKVDGRWKARTTGGHAPSEHLCVCVCARACVRACVLACVYVCVVGGGKGRLPDVYWPPVYAQIRSHAARE